MNPCFSVLLPTKNRLTYLRHAVETVRRQDHQDWEIVISDNCSEDDIAGYVGSLGESRIRYVRTATPLHVTANWNNALTHASGDYVIMLGDDDGLSPGYFSRMQQLITAHGRPELIFSSAAIYAYPGVMPEFPGGFLKRDASPLFQRPAPYFLGRSQARSLVAASLDFRMTFPFNMQYSLVGRPLIEALSRRGSFYASPYPDYYATNALFLVAERILIEPTPRVIIGITPKSYGFYHFNAKEEEGLAFLANEPDQAEVALVRDHLLPGTRAASAWLLAMQVLSDRFPEQRLRVGYARYRRMQMGNYYKRYHLLGDLDRAHFAELLSRLHWRERWIQGPLLAATLRLARIGGRGSHRRILDVIRRCTGNSHAGSLDLQQQGSAPACRNLLELFELGSDVLTRAQLPAQATPA